MALTKVRGLGLGTLDDNITFSTSGKGVHLGVTSATASNLLDDYEEGTWTPTHGGNNMTFSSGAASYVKVGKVVTILADAISAAGSSTSNQIGNLPFTSTGPHGSAHVSFTSGSNNSASSYICGTTLNFIQNASQTGANILATERVIFMAVYYTSA